MKKRKPDGHGISRLHVKEPAEYTFYSPMNEQRKKEAILRQRAAKKEYERKLREASEHQQTS